MSTIQQVKSKTKTKHESKTNTRTEITTEQSQKLVQTMLTMSFGCLTFLRGLFPDDNFVDQRFVPEKVDKNYNKNTTSHANSIKIKTLVRGKSTEADLFLDWLENGVFHSIKLKYLKALSLGIFTDENKPHELLENYIFGFDYDNRDTFTLRINNEGETISLLDSRKMVQQLMRRFIIITQSLDPLPEKRFLTMRLMFNDSAPDEYQPHLFKDASFDKPATIKIPATTDLDTYSVGALDTNHHKVSVKVLSLVDNGKQAIDPTSVGVTRNLDPFDLIGNNTSEADASLGQTSQCKLAGAASQTTNMLQDILKSSSVNVYPTQVMEAFPTCDCECDIPCPSTTTKIMTCTSCKRKVHGICYGNFKSNNVPACISCIATGSIDTTTKQFKVMMMLRRIYRYMTKRPDFPNSLTAIYEKLIGDLENEELIELINLCLNILFNDGTFVIDEKRRRSSANTHSYLKSSNYIDIDHKGVFVPGIGELQCGSRHIWSFLYNSPTAQEAYTTVLPNSMQELNDWLNSVKKSIDIIERGPQINDENVLSSSIDFHSLKITDDSTQDPIISGKRKHINLDNYLDDDNSSQFVDTINMTTPSPQKIRKISVSKKTLRSVW